MSQRYRFVVLLMVIVLAVGFVAWVLQFGPMLSEDFSASALTALIRSWGPWGVVASIGLMTLHSLVPFPAEILALANGMVYGPFWGGTITWVGAMVGAFVAFGIARAFGQPLVRRLTPEKHRHRVEAWSQTEGGGMLLLSRLIPVVAFNLINYAAGLTQISWFTFTWATGIGILPLVIVLSVAGESVEHMSWQAWFGLGGAAVCAWFLLNRLTRSHRLGVPKQIP